MFRKSESSFLKITPKYLLSIDYFIFCGTLGYHQCTRDEAAILAALIYRVKFGENKSELSNVTQMLRELVPTDLIKSSSTQGNKKNM